MSMFLCVVLYPRALSESIDRDGGGGCLPSPAGPCIFIPIPTAPKNPEPNHPLPKKTQTQAKPPLLLLCSSYPCFGAARATLAFLVAHPSPAAIEALIVQGLPPPLPGVRVDVPHPFYQGMCVCFFLGGGEGNLFIT